MDEAITSIRQFPRIALAHLPTPIEPLHHFSQTLGGPPIWVKRDDLTGLATGGNKTRKLEFLMGEAVASQADSVITAGSTQSNHARQTAAAARRVGLEPHLVLYAPGGQAPTKINGNVLLDYLLGAQIHWTGERAPYTKTITRVQGELKAAGKSPRIIPYGGSNGLGIMGYVTAMQEIAEDIEELGLPAFDTHVFATSSGGTQAGMILGAYVTGMLGNIRLLGISIDDREAVLGARVANLVNDGARLLGLDWRVNDDIADVNDDYLGGGYAVIGDAEVAAVRRDEVATLPRGTLIVAPERAGDV